LGFVCRREKDSIGYDLAEALRTDCSNLLFADIAKDRKWRCIALIQTDIVHVQQTLKCLMDNIAFLLLPWLYFQSLMPL
jgi:hypothetical protein